MLIFSLISIIFRLNDQTFGLQDKLELENTLSILMCEREQIMASTQYSHTLNCLVLQLLSKRAFDLYSTQLLSSLQYFAVKQLKTGGPASQPMSLLVVGSAAEILTWLLIGLKNHRGETTIPSLPNDVYAELPIIVAAFLRSADHSSCWIHNLHQVIRLLAILLQIPEIGFAQIYDTAVPDNLFELLIVLRKNLKRANGNGRAAKAEERRISDLQRATENEIKAVLMAYLRFLPLSRGQNLVDRVRNKHFPRDRVNNFDSAIPALFIDMQSQWIQRQRDELQLAFEASIEANKLAETKLMREMDRSIELTRRYFSHSVIDKIKKQTEPEPEPEPQEVEAADARPADCWDWGRSSILMEGKGDVDVKAVCVSANGKYLASGLLDGTVSLWDLGLNSANELQGQTHELAVHSLSFNSDSSLFASGSEDKTIKIWSIDRGWQKTLEGHTHPVRTVAFSPKDIHLLASGSADKSIRLWNVSEGTCLWTWIGHEQRVCSVCFSLDGEILASGSLDCTIKLWHLDGSCLNTLIDSSINSKVWSLSFGGSRDSPLVAAGYEDGTVALWTLENNAAVLRKLMGHRGIVCTVCFNGDGQVLASGSTDSTITIWRIEDGACQRTLAAHSKIVWSVSFGPRELASGSRDGSIRIWGRS